MKTRTVLQICCMLVAAIAQVGFAQWTPVTTPMQDVNYLEADGVHMLAQTSTGFYFSSDAGMTWVSSNSGVADSLVNMFPADSVNFLLADLKQQIPPLPGGLNIDSLNIDFSSLSSILTSLSILYPDSLADSILISLDSGVSSLTPSQIVEIIAMHVVGLDTTDILARIDTASTYLSINGGKDWVSFQEIISSINLRAALKTDYYAYAGTNRGVFRAAIASPDWQQVNNGLGADTSVHALAGIGDVLFAGTNGGVYRSTDNGTTWSAFNSGLGNTNVHALQAVSTALFAGTNGGGVFLSTNYGSSWSEVNDGLTNKYVNALAVGGTTLFAGTIPGGLWQRPLSQMITAINDKKDNVPEKYSLHQNYPNPFNPTTVIGYDMPKAGHIFLRVYDLLGRVVANLVNEKQTAGFHTVTFTADNLPSGVYVYRLQAGNYVEAKKLVILK